MDIKKEFKDFKMPISHLTNTGNSIHAAADGFLLNFQPPHFEWEIVTATKLDDENLLVGLYVTYDNDQDQ
ncbi:MAG: hypothetical protein WBP08_06150 [Saprospiraceae bacterium]|nr:hypothetical protein [Saprospiraceae bacterium]